MTIKDHNGVRLEDEAAIQAIFDWLAESWNRGDGAAYGRLFTEDADYIDVTGAHHKGGEAIGRVHQFLFDGPLKGSTLEAAGHGVEVSFLTPDVGIVIGSGSPRREGQAEAPDDRGSVSTTVLVQRDGEWRVRAFQNNRVQPPRDELGGEPRH